MSSLIEQAALRLAQIREAGIAVPGEAAPVVPDIDTSTLTAPEPEHMAAAADATVRLPPARSAADVAVDVAVESAVDAPRVGLSGFSSRQVELDLAALAEGGYLVPNAPRSHMADQYRVIKRPLIANATARGKARVEHGNLIMMTSAMPGEGKSFTSINLAMSIASELDHTVMLVDADVARPSVLRMLGLPPGPDTARDAVAHRSIRTPHQRIGDRQHRDHRGTGDCAADQRQRAFAHQPQTALPHGVAAGFFDSAGAFLGHHHLVFSPTHARVYP